MRVQDIMVTEVKSCRPGTDLAAVTQIMWANDCGALPVVDNGGKVIGMITDRDISIALWSKNRLPSDVVVSQVKPPVVYTCAAEDDIHAALDTMQTRQVRRLPVVGKDGSLRGLLCLNDIALNAKKQNALSYADVVKTLQAVCGHRMVRQATAA